MASKMIIYREPAFNLCLDSRSEAEVLAVLRKIIDPDFGADIVTCGFVKDLAVSAEGDVTFRLELTTPACPVKEQFESEARAQIGTLTWLRDLKLTMSAQPPRAAVPDQPALLRRVANIIAVSSCKGGVGKSTVAVNLAYSLMLMGARVGLFDADVYGPSLPTMISPELAVLQMDAVTKAITPVEYEGVKCVSFGFAGQGSAIMRGPMVSGVVNQLLTTTDWGELDYLVVDFPPGTGDIQLTLCQVVPLAAAVVVTTPQKLAFIDVAKGIQMFAKLRVPCVAVVENMAFFEVDGVKHFPFGKGSGQRIVRDFAVPHLFQMPIVADLSAAGDGGRPLVVADPAGAVARAFGDVAASVVQEVAKLRRASRDAVVYDPAIRAIRVRPPAAPGTTASTAISTDEYALHPALVRRNDRSAASVDEWTGKPLVKPESIPESLAPTSITPLGNYAVQITWEDGFNQVAPFDLLASIERLVPPEGGWGERPPPAGTTAVAPTANKASGPPTGATAILANAQKPMSV